MSATIYRIRLDNSGVSAQLRGIAGTQTDGLSIDGTYSSVYDAHEFIISVSGRYELWTDPLGGTDYAKVSSWGGTDGKYIPSSDLERPILYTAYATDYPSLNDALNSLSSSKRNLYLPPGTYPITSILESPFDGFTMRGCGAASIITVPDGLDHAVKIDSFDGCVLENVMVQGPNTNARSGIFLNGTSKNNVLGPGLIISGFGYAVEEDAAGTADSNIIMGNVLTGNGYTPPILLRDASKSKMIGNIWDE